MNLTDLPKTPDEAYALGAAHAYKESADLFSTKVAEMPCAAILAKIRDRQKDAESRIGDFYAEGPSDHVNKARHMLLALEMLGVEGLDGACKEALGGYYFLLRAVSEHLEAADETFRGYLHREPFELEDQDGNRSETDTRRDAERGRTGRPCAPLHLPLRSRTDSPRSSPAA